MGSIPAEQVYDPWPKNGLVAKYKPFILKWAKRFHEYNPSLRWEDILNTAIRLTWESSQTFKPELGFDFATHLRKRLWGGLLDAFHIECRKRTEPDVLKTDPLRFLGGGNGARLVLDTGTLTVGTRVTGNDLDYLIGTLERIRSDSQVVDPNHPHAAALIRAIVDHAERRERESLAEGDCGETVILEARELMADVRFFKDNRLLVYKPKLVITDLSEERAIATEYIGEKAYSIVDRQTAKAAGMTFKRDKAAGQKLYAKPPVPKGNEILDVEARALDRYVRYADLTDKEHIAVEYMRTNVSKTDTEIAALVGITQGGYAKMKVRVIKKLQEGKRKSRLAKGLSPLDDEDLFIPVSYTPSYPRSFSPNKWDVDRD